jgi:hypothetical protein
MDLDVEALSDATKMLGEGRVSARQGLGGYERGAFSRARYSTGDPCTMVGGRPWLALRTPISVLYVCGPRDPHDVRSCEFPVGGDVVDPRRLCSSCLRRMLRKIQAHIQLVFCAVTAQPAEIRLVRPTRNPPSHRTRIGGPDGPGGVASSISILLSWRGHRETWMTAARSVRSLELP